MCSVQAFWLEWELGFNSTQMLKVLAKDLHYIHDILLVSIICFIFLWFYRGAVGGISFENQLYDIQDERDQKEYAEAVHEEPTLAAASVNRYAVFWFLGKNTGVTDVLKMNVGKSDIVRWLMLDTYKSSLNCLRDKLLFSTHPSPYIH